MAQQILQANMKFNITRGPLAASPQNRIAASL
jgi:hypothetical protein